ncbi:argininosuccinate synthase [Candidatus Riflebacteria bacterium]
MSGKKNVTPMVKKIVLAYSGGLDTTVIIPWLKENYPDSKIIAVCTNVGLGEELEGLEQKALKSGADKYFCVDLQEELVKNYIFPMLKAGALYENTYFLGTAIARPAQAKAQVDICRQEGADAVSHGCTGKGNDQVRFELTYKALAPHLKVIAPWRLWDISSREDALDYARKRNIDLSGISETKLYSRDANLWHTSTEGEELESSWNEPSKDVHKVTVSPEEAPDTPQYVDIKFEKGKPIALNGVDTGAVELLEKLNEIGAKNAIGRADVIENRLVGMKSRGVYETPGGTILYRALDNLKRITLDRESYREMQDVGTRYADLVYNGKWFTGLRKAYDAFVNSMCEFVTGSVKLKLYRGNILYAGVKSPYSLYLEDLATFGESKSYKHSDASGFINLYGLSVGVSYLAQRDLHDIDDGQIPEIAELSGFRDK